MNKRKHFISYHHIIQQTYTVKPRTRKIVWQISTKASYYRTIFNEQLFFKKVTCKIGKNSAIADNFCLTNKCAIARFYCTLTLPC